MKSARYLKRRFDVCYDHEKEVMVTVGGSEAIDIALRAMLGSRRRGFDSTAQLRILFAVHAPCGRRSRDHRIGGKRPVPSDKGKASGEAYSADENLILPSPTIPQAPLWNGKIWKKLPVSPKEKDLFLLSDEIYSELTYGRRHCTIAALPGMKERTVLINGFSKSYAMTGWRWAMPALRSGS